MAHRICPNCRSTESARIKRNGLFHIFLLPLLGLYPWECSDCRKVFLRRTRGTATRSRVSARQISGSNTRQA